MFPCGEPVNASTPVCEKITLLPSRERAVIPNCEPPFGPRLLIFSTKSKTVFSILEKSIVTLMIWSPTMSTGAGKLRSASAGKGKKIGQKTNVAEFEGYLQSVRRTKDLTSGVL